MLGNLWMVRGKLMDAASRVRPKCRAQGVSQCKVAGFWLFGNRARWPEANSANLSRPSRCMTIRKRVIQTIPKTIIGQSQKFPHMKILVYSPYPLDNNSMPVLIDEAIEYLQDEANEVHVITCNGTLSRCDSNYEGSRVRCAECRLSSGLLQNKIKHPRLKFSPIEHHLNSSTTREIKNQKFTYKTIDEVKEIKYKGINVGLGVVSSYVSMTRNLNPEFTPSLRQFFDDLLTSASLIVEAAQSKINEINPDVIFIFNGRFAGIRPVYELGIRSSIKTEVFECTFSSSREFQKKVKFTNALPHDIDNASLLIEEAWSSNGNDVDKVESANDFYKRRRNAEPASDRVYTASQVDGLLPDGWDTTKKNYVIFNSSEDEFFCVGESFDKYKVFKNQIQGIKYLLLKAKDDPRIHYYLRIHPNLSGVNFQYHTALRDIFKNEANITVIEATSKVSTYKLIDCCEKVFVFGSTAGAEAAYWGKPVILLGGSFYLHLDIAYYPKSLEELDQFIIKDLTPKSKIGALKYANFIYGERGAPPKHFDFNYSQISFGQKTILAPRCYSFKNQLWPYLLITAFMRTLNLPSHLFFKKIKMRKLMSESDFINAD